ncbi:hypothetical protein [Haloarcula onubensis]|uniref:Rhomboid family intramembrane serine protease n=1 Tax=Haloarcula onubensis TaxID=2950539 RepID=A0ABU2FPC8_9EURY|nr:hypothetical protein [Halomicroarcula sp. S3CR25-11]MDS0282616.1 hypothetical protein [Halomicroarcula sp. S3CR25-11]
MSLDRPPFGRALRQRVEGRDLAVLAVVPCVLLAAFLLPVSTRQALAFEYADPSLLSAFASAYVHTTAAHLAVNLLGYLLVGSVTFATTLLCGYRTRLYVALFTYLTVFPFLLAGFGLLFVRQGVGLGFSGVLLALYGYLPLALSDFVTEQFHLDAERNAAPLLFFLGLGIVTVLGVWPSLSDGTVLLGSAGLVVVIALVLAWYGLAIIDEDDELRTTLSLAWRASGYAELFVVALVVFVTFPLAMFPPDIVPQRTVVDTYTHLLAYALGFTATYVASLASDALADGERAWL